MNTAVSAPTDAASRRPIGSFRAVALASTCTAVLACTAFPPSASAATESNAVAAAANAVSQTTPTRLVQSTGNLYWSTNKVNEFGPSTSTVYRASKLGRPGEERPLYSETHSGQISFDALAYANVNGVWYGFVVVNNFSTSTSTIKRFPLAGGAATTLLTSPRVIGSRDLVADSTSLFWADAGGLRAAAVSGGAVRTLSDMTTASRVALTSTRVYYSGSTFLRSVAKSGGATSPLVTTNADITALHVKTTAPARVYWGQRDGQIKSVPLTGGEMVTHRPAAALRYVTSVSYDGSRILWITCSNSNNDCTTAKTSSAGTVAVASGRVGSSDVQGDSTAMYWGDHAVQRYAH